MIVGHRKALEALFGSYLSPVTLLLGPESVGKWTIAREYARDREVSEFDVLEVPRLTADKAREVVRFCQTAPLGSTPKLVLIDLDGATEQAATILLKTLEEPPDTVRFILVASGRVLPTILSRANVIRFGLLDQAEVQHVLMEQGVPAPKAAVAASASGGRVGPALAVSNASGAARDAVEAALRAVQAKDLDALRKAFRGWGDEEHRLLLAWAAESAVGQLHIPASVPVRLGESRGRWVLMQCSALGPVRPSLGDRVVLEELARR